MADVPIIIVGGGAAGLSTAAALKQAGLDAIILDKDRQIGGTWARRYDRLHLHTTRWLSGLAHDPMPARLPRYPSRDQLVAYLRAYARRFDLKIVGGCSVQRVERAPGDTEPAWLVSSSCGTWRSQIVVIATGHYNRPIIPSWPGQDSYQGSFSHSVEYRNGLPYAGKRMLVIGAGNSGTEIATSLAEQGAAAVAISVRTPPPIVPRDPFGIPVQLTGILMSHLPAKLADLVGRTIAQLWLGDLTRYGLRPAAWLPFSAHHVPVIDVGFVRELKRGRVQVRPNIARFTPSGVLFADGNAEDFDGVIAATGFHTGLREMIDAPGVIDERGLPIAHSGQPTAQPGLYFMGYTEHLRGHLYEANRDSRQLAAHIRSYLRQSSLAPHPATLAT